MFEFNYLSDNSWENLISSPAKKKKIPQQNKTFVFRREDGSAVRRGGSILSSGLTPDHFLPTALDTWSVCGEEDGETGRNPEPPGTAAKPRACFRGQPLNSFLTKGFGVNKMGDGESRGTQSELKILLSPYWCRLHPSLGLSQ